MLYMNELYDGVIIGWFNWLCVGVLGVNDGIVLVVVIVVGVVGVINQLVFIFMVGVVVLVGGVILMVLGEYVFVSSQCDSECVFVVKEWVEFVVMFDEELVELIVIYQVKGFSFDIV